MALGLLIASPLAGAWADRRGARSLAAIGLLVTAAGMAGMTLLQTDTPYWQAAVWLAITGAGSGMFNSPNTAAMMGAVPEHRRGIAGGTRMMLQNTGSVLSIAFVLAIVTSAVPTKVLLSIFSGVTTGLSDSALDPFIRNMHLALWVLAGTAVLGALVSLLRPRTLPAASGGSPEAVEAPSRIEAAA
jgi:MFS family permease